MRVLNLLFLVCLAALALLAVGCASTGDDDKVSERPWNAPRSWENGMPPSLYERR